MPIQASQRGSRLSSNEYQFFIGCMITLLGSGTLKLGLNFVYQKALRNVLLIIFSGFIVALQFWTLNFTQF